MTATINDGTGTYWSSKFTYTEYNAVATRQDARGVVTTYSYDALHRVTGISYNTVSGVTKAPSVSYVYDNDPTYGTSAMGQLVRVNVGSSYQERSTFDGYKRVTSVIRTMGSRTYTSSYQYNQGSQLTQVTYPSARTVAVNHDDKGRMQSLTTNPGETSGYLTGISYNIAGQVTGLTLGNGVVETYGYDANRLQLTTQTATKTTGGGGPPCQGCPPPPPPTTTTYLDLTYNYQATAGQMGAGSTAGNAGQLMSISGTINNTTESASFSYDLLGRLATSNQTSNGASGQRRFGYDRWGNRTGVWDAVTGGNQIQSITLQQSGGAPTNRITSVTSGSTLNYSYDAAGNVTNDGVHSYTYDSENRVVSVDGGATAQYSYDNQNRRWKKTTAGSTTHYVWQGSQVLAEHNGTTGAVLVDYIYSGSRMIAKVASGSTQYFLSDRLSLRMTLNSSGTTVLGRQAHLPFGDDFAESGTQEKHHFTSYERDSESGLDYAINRYDNSNLGRFTSVDPKASSAKKTLAQSWNRYTYAINDPINMKDPWDWTSLAKLGAEVRVIHLGRLFFLMGLSYRGKYFASRCLLPRFLSLTLSLSL